MFVSLAFGKTSVQAKTAEFCIFTTYHLLVSCPSLRVCLVYFTVDRWIWGLLKLLMSPRHSWLPKKMLRKSQSSLGTLISSGTPDPGGQAVHEGDRWDTKADETGETSDGGEQAANEDRCRWDEGAVGQRRSPPRCQPPDTHRDASDWVAGVSSFRAGCFCFWIDYTELVSVLTISSSNSFLLLWHETKTSETRLHVIQHGLIWL